jgi:hypothetical protein
MVDQGTSGDRRAVPTEAWSSVATIDPPRPPAPPGTSTPHPPSGGGRRGAPWWVVVVAALLAALLAGGGVYAWARATATPAGATKSDQLVLELTQQLQGLQAELTRTKAELDALKKAAATTTTTGTTPQPQSDTSSTSKQYTLIKKVYLKGGTWYITADYIQFLTGSAAAAAATAHGDESPPPNDFYIVNDNKLLREVPVAATANVKIMGGEGGDPANPSNQSIATFHDWFVSGDSAKNWVKDGVYVLTLASGKVTAIDQQFVP